MNGRHIFHLSIPVSDLNLAVRFHVGVLAAMTDVRAPEHT
jgi:extradiol dioxygenase family protein